MAAQPGTADDASTYFQDLDGSNKGEVSLHHDDAALLLTKYRGSV
jgi:hypothetical protein